MFNELLDYVDDCVSEGRFDDAIHFVHKQIRKEGKSHALLYNLAYVYLNKGWKYWEINEFAYDTGDMARAIRYARMAVHLNPRCPLSRLLLADALVHARKEREARRIYNGIIRQDISELAGGICGEGVIAARTYYADALYGLAESYDLNDDYSNAAETFERCITFIRTHHVKSTRKTLCEIKSELKCLRTRMSSPPQTTVSELINEKRYDEAMTLAKREIRSHGKDHLTLVELAEIYIAKGWKLSALKASKEAAQIANRCPLVNLTLGKALSVNGDYEAAIDVFMNVAKRNIRMLASGRCGEGLRSARAYKADALLNIARNCRNLGKMEEALVWYNRCVAYRRKNMGKINRCEAFLNAIRKEMAEIR